MTHQPCDRVSQSGVSWLGRVPSHWTLRRLGYFFEERREKVSDKEYPPLSVTKNGIVPQLDTAAKTDDGDNRKRVVRGDFVINSRSDRKGSAGIAEVDGSVSLINTVLRPQAEALPRFVHYLLRSSAFQEEFYRYGQGIVADLWTTRYSEMRAILLAMPPFPEQVAIAAFLDRETDKIDALVGEQKRLIELLKEKRQAVISHAVTKGLDPNVPMKPSRVEWLGNVPEHWELLPVKRVASVFVPQRNKPDLNAEAEGLPWVTMENMAAEEIFTSEVHVSAASASNAGSRLLPTGSVVASCVGNFGVASITRREVIINQQLQAYLPSEDVLAEFLRLAVIAGKPYFEQVGTAATLVYVNQEGFANFPIALPPIHEQKLIALEVRKVSEGITSLIEDITRASELLLERRAALITAAVTGKISVTIRSTGADAA